MFLLLFWWLKHVRNQPKLCPVPNNSGHRLAPARVTSGYADTVFAAASNSPNNPRDFRKALSFSAGSESKGGAGSNRKNNSVTQGHRYFSGAQIIARQGLQGRSVVGPSGVAESPKSRTVPFSTPKGGQEGRGGAQSADQGDFASCSPGASRTVPPFLGGQRTGDSGKVQGSFYPIPINFRQLCRLSQDSAPARTYGTYVTYVVLISVYLLVASQHSVEYSECLTLAFLGVSVTRGCFQCLLQRIPEASLKRISVHSSCPVTSSCHLVW